MCGIVGFTGEKNSKLIAQMNNEIFHRGPDNSGLFESDQLTLAMRRLSIVDIDQGNQPYFFFDKSIVVTFNGEIYNHKELREELIKDGYMFSSDHSDGEIIPNLYLKYGVDFVNRLNGMFAISLYDANNNKLFLFRDRIGKKPLYYTTINKRLYFASEIKSLLYIEHDFKIDKKSLINYLQLKDTSAPNTIYQDIKQLMPASYIAYDISKKVFTQNQYWSLNFTNKLNLSEVEISDKLTELLEDAVKIRTQCDVEYGAYLSGGLDSSLITSMIVKNHNTNVKTFSLGYKDDFKNKQSDLYHAKELSKKLGTNHYEYILDSKEVFDELSNVLKAFDEPFSGTISTYFLTKLISKHVKVSLSGDGADELFGSYLTHRLSNPIEYYNSLQNKDFSHLTQNDKRRLAPYDSLNQFEFLKQTAESDIQKWRNKLNVFNDAELKLLCNDIEIENPYERISLSSISMLDKCLEIDQKELLANQILPFIDRLSMAHSVEVRTPFLDYRVVEFASRIPSSLKIKNSVNKYILKLASNKYLDKDIINRPKEGFVLPVYKWIEKQYFTQVKNTILDINFIDFFSFNKIYIERLLNEFDNGADHHAKVWNLYNLAIWHEGIK
ncbi:asparagine synthase (glutamine-hydrolyzing) [Sulfurimonas sp.]|uniref:asparagine synthase (glutamine-hydrolyzing) n=1 Tax=Sulfurimonas sp. TaxID=2022749 RepID=UPI00356272D2